MVQTNLFDTELVDKTNTNTRDEMIISSEVQNETESSSITEKISGFLKFFTVEPIIFCYLFPIYLSENVIRNFESEVACRVDLNYSETICATIHSCCAEEISRYAIYDTNDIVDELESLLYLIEISVRPIILLFAGAWSDRTGNRKALLLIPISGSFISAICRFVISYFFEWPLWVHGLTHAIQTTLTGGWILIVLGATCFLADVTTIESRTFRIGIANVIMWSSIPIGSALAEILPEILGYYGILGLNILFYGFGIVYGYFRIEDVKKKPSEGSCVSKIIDFFHPKNPWDTLSLLFSARGQQLIRIVLLIFGYVVIIGTIEGQDDTLYTYIVNERSFMDDLAYDWFFIYTETIILIGEAVAVTVFSKRMKMHDALLGVISTVSHVAGSLIYALAWNRYILYVAPLVTFFKTVNFSILKSLSTKVVQPENVGKMCSLIGVLEILFPVASIIMFQHIYYSTRDIFPGIPQIVFAALITPAVFIYLFMYQREKQERDGVENSDDGEINAQENAVTVL